MYYYSMLNILGNNPSTHLVVIARTLTIPIVGGPDNAKTAGVQHHKYFVFDVYIYINRTSYRFNGKISKLLT